MTSAQRREARVVQKARADARWLLEQSGYRGEMLVNAVAEHLAWYHWDGSRKTAQRFYDQRHRAKNRKRGR